MIQFEHEAKSLITKQDFNQLLTKYKLTKNIKQENIYFETNHNFFKNMGAALRIRNYDDSTYELTIKIKNKDSNTEHNYQLTYEQFVQIKDTYQFPNFTYPFTLPSIDYAISTITFRYQLNYHDHIIEIDQTHFNDVIDFEIEVESESIMQANKIMQLFLNENDILFKKSSPKIARYYQYNQ